MTNAMAVTGTIAVGCDDRMDCIEMETEGTTIFVGSEDNATLHYPIFLSIISTPVICQPNAKLDIQGKCREI